MILQFATVALALLLLAIAFVVVPLLWRGGIGNSGDASQTNIRLAKNSLRELQGELDAGEISAEQFAAAREELENALGDDLQDNAEPATAQGDGRWLALPLAFAVPVLALGLYAALGDFRSFDSSASAVAAAPHSDTAQPDIDAMLQGLVQRLEKQPQDLQGWLMLGRSYKTLKRYQEAAAALKKAQALSPENADILLQLADALAMAQGGALQGEPAALVAKALLLEPENEMGLWLSGMAKSEQGQYQEAIALWQKLQRSYPPQDPEYQQIQQLIDAAKGHLGD